MKTVIDKVKASKMKCKRNRDAWKTKALEAVRELSFWKTQMAARDRQIEERWSGLRKQYQERIDKLVGSVLVLNSKMIQARMLLGTEAINCGEGTK